MELLLGVAVGTIGLFVWGLRRLGKAVRTPRDRARQHLRTLRRSRAADVHAGRSCAVVGVIQPLDKSLMSPVTETECAAWELRVWLRLGMAGRGGRLDGGRATDGREIILVAAAAQVASMFVEDDSGVVRIDPTGAVPLLTRFQTTSTRAELPAAVVKILEQQKCSTSGEFHLDEAILCAGESVVVGGVAAVEADPSGVTADYRTAATRPVLRSSRQLPLCVSNDPEIVKGDVR